MLFPRTRFLSAISGMLLVTLPWLASARNEKVADPIRQAVEKAVGKLRPSLVRIQVVSAEYAQGREIKYQLSGSGVIISRQGHVITNHHVAGHAARLLCVFADNEEIEARLVGTDPMSDISVIQFNPPTKREFAAAEFGDSDRVQVGDSVLAMGSPLAFSQSVTLGIVSNTRLIMPRSAGWFGQFVLDGEDVGALVRWIGHDAAIYPGNSGGPLVNLQGQVIGINEISLGLGGAIPGNLAQDVARQIIRDGRVRRSWLGMEVQPLLTHAGPSHGVLVSGVFPGSPAARAQIQSGDVLVRLDGKPVDVHHAEEVPLFNQMTARIPVGKEVEAVLVRNGAEKTVKLTTVERPPMEGSAREFRAWGITARNLSLLAAQELKLNSPDGVYVTSVRPGGPGGEARPPLQPHDLIQDVNGHAIRNGEELAALTDQLIAGATKPRPVIVGIERRYEKLVTVVKLGSKQTDDASREATHAWLPVAVQVVTHDMAEQFGDGKSMGVRITQVYTHSAAESAGFRTGDRILRVDGEPVAASQPGDEEVFTTMIRQYRVGARPAFTVRRGTETLTITAELVPAPKQDREMKKYRDDRFEFTARNLSFFDHVQEGWSDQQTGALVTEVTDGGWAALGHLSAGDLIVAVNRDPITDVDSLETKVKALVQQKSKVVVMCVMRGIHTRYLELEPDWDGTSTPSHGDNQ